MSWNLGNIFIDIKTRLTNYNNASSFPNSETFELRDDTYVNTSVMLV